LEANTRFDGSSRFPPNNRWGVFPSVSLGWVLTKEHFLEKVSWLSNLKLRGSLGNLGNQNIGSAYPSVAVVSSGQNYSFNQTVAPR